MLARTAVDRRKESVAAWPCGEDQDTLFVHRRCLPDIALFDMSRYGCGASLASTTKHQMSIEAARIPEDMLMPRNPTTPHAMVRDILISDRRLAMRTMHFVR
jgi:hypothetical protein